MEHNSVMRPVNRLAATRGVAVEKLAADGEGWLDPSILEGSLRQAPARLLAVTHASNVTGTIQEVRDLADICHRHGTLLLVDAAQSAGSLPIDCAATGIDLLAFTGHKALFGPTGIGGLVVGEGIDLEPLIVGGTGSRSEREEHPDFLPDRLEGGTPNTVGIVGLGAGVAFINGIGLKGIRDHEVALTGRLLDGLGALPGVTLQGPREPERRVPVVSATIAGLTPSDIGYLLDTAYDIKVRVGLHCAPSAHRTIGTFPDGTVRFSLGWFTTADEIDATVAAVAAIAARAAR
jgi:selenocysteine lyase/cysteine desulfurase